VPFEARQLAFGIGLDAAQVHKFVKVVSALYDAYLATDASLLEINPLVVTAAGDLLALDAEDELRRQRARTATRHRETARSRRGDPLEIEASKFSLNYIILDGNIGCMVNGAGLAMATMDIIKLAGGEPANFLDVGGGANAEQIPQRVQDPDVGQEREGGAHQHLRRHPALRRAGAGRHRRRERARACRCRS
jgi:succinyl-CoA synthetase beta subunit